VTVDNVDGSFGLNTTPPEARTAPKQSGDFAPLSEAS